MGAHVLRQSISELVTCLFEVVISPQPHPEFFRAVHESHDRDGWTQRRIDRLFFRCVRAGRFDLTGLITHEFSPRDCAAAYALAGDRRGQAMGILFDRMGES